jgi:hypothetical protein
LFDHASIILILVAVPELNVAVAVAVTPLPPGPDIVIVGGVVVYPSPLLVSVIAPIPKDNANRAPDPVALLIGYMLLIYVIGSDQVPPVVIDTVAIGPVEPPPEMLDTIMLTPILLGIPIVSPTAYPVPPDPPAIVADTIVYERVAVGAKPPLIKLPPLNAMVAAVV